MTFLNYTHAHKQQLSDLLVLYFPEVGGDDIPESIIRGKLTDLIDTQHRDGIIHVLLIQEQEIFVGFSIFQLDTSESDWCKRPGWGFIREFYVVPEYRHRGIGRQLAVHTEKRLRELGTDRLYLTSDPAALAFWQRCGWRLTEEICSNDLSILEK